MPLLRADVEMANNAIQNLGSQALQRRKLQQEHDFEMQRLAMESQLRDVQEKRYGAQEAHFNRMESAQQDNYKLQSQRQDATAGEKSKELAGRIIGDMKKNYAGYVKDGIMDASVATDIVKSSVAKMPPQAQAVLQDNPDYQSILDDKFQFVSPPGKPGLKDDNEIARDKYAQILIGQAKDAQAKGDSAGAQDLMARAKRIQDSIGGNDPSKYQTETTTTPGHEGSQAIITPAKTGGLFGIGNHDAITNAPAIPAVPTTTITRKVRVGDPPPVALPPGLPNSVTGSPVKSTDMSHMDEPGADSPPTPNQQVPGMGAAQSPSMVRVRHPNGQTGMIPAANLANAIKQGYSQVPDASQ